MTVEITDDLELKQYFLDKLKDKYSTPRYDVHISDLIYCLREAYSKKVDPRPPTDKTLSNFADGNRRHLVLQALSELRSEVQITDKEPFATVDMVWDGPIEAKTTKSRREDILPHYIRQLGYYAALMDKETGRLIIQRINAKPEEGEEIWVVKKFKWTAEQRAALREQIMILTSMLRRALDEKNPGMLPRAFEPWKCRDCSYVQDCKELDLS